MRSERETETTLTPLQRADREQEEAALRPLLGERERQEISYYRRRVQELEQQLAATEDPEERKGIERQLDGDRAVLESLAGHDAEHDKAA